MNKYKRNNEQNFEYYTQSRDLNYVVLDTIDGHTSKKGCNYGKENINPYHIVIDVDQGCEFIVMNITEDVYTILDLTTIDHIKKTNSSWFLCNNGYIASNFNDTQIYLHQYLMNLWGQGKGTVSIDHINRDKLDNRLQNLRYASSSVQNTNMGKKNRQYNAQELPTGITHDMLPKYVYYSTEVLRKGTEREYTRDFFRIEKHPNLHKKCVSSSKSNNVSIQEKLKQIKEILFNLNQGMNPQPAKELPPYYRLHTTKDKHFLIYERRINGQRQNLKMVLPSNYNISSELEKLKEKIRLKYNNSTPHPCTTASYP